MDDHFLFWAYFLLNTVSRIVARVVSLIIERKSRIGRPCVDLSRGEVMADGNEEDDEDGGGDGEEQREG